MVSPPPQAPRRSSAVGPPPPGQPPASPRNASSPHANPSAPRAGGFVVTGGPHRSQRRSPASRGPARRGPRGQGTSSRASPPASTHGETRSPPRSRVTRESPLAPSTSASAGSAARVVRPAPFASAPWPPLHLRRPAYLD